MSANPPGPNDFRLSPDDRPSQVSAPPRRPRLADRLAALRHQPTPRNEPKMARSEPAREPPRDPAPEPREPRIVAAPSAPAAPRIVVTPTPAAPPPRALHFAFRAGPQEGRRSKRKAPPAAEPRAEPLRATPTAGSPRTPSPPPPPKPPRKRAGGASGGGGNRRWAMRLLGWGISLGIWGAIALAGILGYYAMDLPSLDTLTATTRKPSITLLAADGQTIAAYGDVYGEALNVADLPPTLPAAVMATEDRHFYSHFGIDLIGLMRATIVNLRAHHVVQGGSTLTQQLAKNLFLTPERNMKRKIQELEMALWLEHKFTKDQIITLYLNRVYLGSGSWGVDAAARRYFDISARNLNLYQSALLAGLLKAPSKYNPQNDPEQSFKRTSQVLANMVAVGAITDEQAQTALRDGPATVKQISHTGRYFADWVHDQVEQYAHGDRDIVVHTTLDMALQHKVEAELEDSLAKSGAKEGVTQGAMVVMTPDGAIRALTGGRDYAKSQFNRAVQGERQPGSSFKAFLYLAAVEAGWTSTSTIEDMPIKTGAYQPGNYTSKYEGPITLRHALAKSSNVAAVRLIEMIGPKRVVGVAKRLGITSDLRPDASLALGTSEVSLLEMTSAYASFANDGNGVFPYGFSEIKDNQGNSVFERQGNGTGRVIDPHALHEINTMLSAVVEEGSGKSSAIDRPTAGKTGTTQDYRDAWFIGFSADYVGGVWFGNDDGTPMHKVSGATLPTHLWHNVMLAAHKGLPVRPLPGLGPEAEPEATAGAPSSVLAPGETLDGIWHGLVKMFGG